MNNCGQETDSFPAFEILFLFTGKFCYRSSLQESRIIQRQTVSNKKEVAVRNLSVIVTIEIYHPQSASPIRRCVHKQSPQISGSLYTSAREGNKRSQGYQTFLVTFRMGSYQILKVFEVMLVWQTYF